MVMPVMVRIKSRARKDKKIGFVIISGEKQTGQRGIGQALQ